MVSLYRLPDATKWKIRANSEKFFRLFCHFSFFLLSKNVPTEPSSSWKKVHNDSLSLSLSLSPLSFCIPSLFVPNLRPLFSATFGIYGHPNAVDFKLKSLFFFFLLRHTPPLADARAVTRSSTDQTQRCLTSKATHSRIPTQLASRDTYSKRGKWVMILVQWFFFLFNNSSFLASFKLLPCCNLVERGFDLLCETGKNSQFQEFGEIGNNGTSKTFGCTRCI